MRLQPLIDRTAYILIVAEEMEERDCLALVLANMGYNNIESANSLDDARERLEKRPYNWLITTLVDPPEDEALGDNVMQLLAEITQRKAWQTMRASLFLKAEQKSCLPLAYELGLLSWHPAKFEEENIEAQFKELLHVVNGYRCDDIRVASHYLRNYLTLEKRYESMAALEEKLIDSYPGQPDLLVHYAYAQLQLNNFDIAENLIIQALYLDGRLAERCREIQMAIAKQRSLHPLPKSTDKANQYGVKSALIIDSDDMVRGYSRNLLLHLGIREIYDFIDGESAWEWLQRNPEPDLIVMEWRLPKLSGMALVQRIRSQGYRNVTIIVMSSLVKPEDIPLLNEMSVANVIAKPFGKEDFYLPLRWTLLQEQQPTDQKVLEKKLLLRLAKGEWDEAKSLKAAFMADKKISEGRKSLVEARFLYHAEEYERARDKVIEAMNQSGNKPLDSVNLLGKCLLKLGEQTSALSCFEKAQTLSPQNLQRLCEIADISANLGKMDKAERTLKKAKKIDRENNDIKTSETKIAIQNNDIDEAKELLKTVASQGDLIGFMNNHAIAITMAGRIDEAIEIYKRTIETIPDSEARFLSIVSYNLGLAYSRVGHYAKANLALQDAVDNPAEEIARRAVSLRRRIQNAMQTGKEPELRLGKVVKNAPQEIADMKFAGIGNMASKESHLDKLLSSQTRPGELCLHLMFKAQEPYDRYTKRLFPQIDTEDDDNESVEAA